MELTMVLTMCFVLMSILMGQITIRVSTRDHSFVSVLFMFFLFNFRLNKPHKERKQLLKYIEMGVERRT